jgi:hypothetical protein
MPLQPSDMGIALQESRCHRSIGATMIDDVFELHAFLEEDGHQKPLYVRIEPPSQGQLGDCCRIHAPLLLKSDKDIFGVDPDQARSNAILVIKILLDGKKVVDSEGKPVRL